MKYIDIKEFRQFGYLQELNRQFLHPLGLALEVQVDDNGNETLGGIQDFRDDPEGIIYADGVITATKSSNVYNANEKMKQSREQLLGFHIQPVGDDHGVEV